LEDFLINSFNAVRLTRREFTSSEIAFTNDGFIPHEFSADFMVWFPIGLIITGLSSLEPSFPAPHLIFQCSRPSRKPGGIEGFRILTP